MEQLLECVPNFSEGRNVQTITAIAEAIKAIPEVKLLHIDKGEAANRTVFTFIGPPKAVIEAAFQAIKVASELIDMRVHKGEHPRIGATDVCPLVPLSNISMEESVLYARALGERVGKELAIPIYLYEYAATKRERKNLALIRSGEYEGLETKMRLSQWRPDYGPTTFNAQTGATVIGARNFLIAYNVNLNTKSVKIAHQIAGTIRESGRTVKVASGKKWIPGQLKAVKAIGWFIKEYDKVQVSMNLTDINKTGIHEAFEACVQEAEKLGVEVTGSELIGLIPQQALVDAGRYFLSKQGKSFETIEQSIEAAIDALGLDELAPFHASKRIIEWVK